MYSCPACGEQIKVPVAATDKRSYLPCLACPLCGVSVQYGGRFQKTAAIAMAFMLVAGIANLVEWHAHPWLKYVFSATLIISSGINLLAIKHRRLVLHVKANQVS